MSDRWSLIIFSPQPATPLCAAVMPVVEPEKHRLLADAGNLCSISDEAFRCNVGSVRVCVLTINVHEFSTRKKNMLCNEEPL